MNAADILEELSAIEAEAKRRGIPVLSAYVGLASYYGHNVHARLTVHPGGDIVGYGDDFADALAALRRETDKRRPHEGVLADVIGVAIKADGTLTEIEAGAK